MPRLLLATRNAHKVTEIISILGPELPCLSLADFAGAPPVEESAPTFAGNATRKAVELATWLASQSEGSRGRTVDFVLADDSGLEVDALGGAPGVHSARFAALDSGKRSNSTDAENNAKLLRLLKNVSPEKRTARFRCVLALTPVFPSHAEGASPTCYSDEFELATELFEGLCEGRLGFELRGKGGFGYDPLFIPTGFEQTYAELAEEVKNRLSHRAAALAKLKARFR